MEPRSGDDEGGKGLAVASLVCLILMLAVFALFRFALKDLLTDSVLESIYPYLIYIVPLIFGAAAFIMALFAMKNKKARGLAIAGMIISILSIAGIFAAMKLLPYEPYSYSVSDDEEETDSDKSDKDKDEDKKADEKADSGLTEVEQDYEDGKLDYVQAKEVLGKLDVDAMDDEETQAVLDFQTKLESDLDTEIKTLAASSDYEEIMRKIGSMRQIAEDDQFFATMSSDELRKKGKKITSPGKRKGYLLYLFCYLWDFSHKVIDDFDFLIFLLAFFSDFAYQNTVNKAVQYGFV